MHWFASHVLISWVAFTDLAFTERLEPHGLLDTETQPYLSTEILSASALRSDRDVLHNVNAAFQEVRRDGSSQAAFAGVTNPTHENALLASTEDQSGHSKQATSITFVSDAKHDVAGGDAKEQGTGLTVDMSEQGQQLEENAQQILLTDIRGRLTRAREDFGAVDDGKGSLETSAASPDTTSLLLEAALKYARSTKTGELSLVATQRQEDCGRRLNVVEKQLKLMSSLCSHLPPGSSAEIDDCKGLVVEVLRKRALVRQDCANMAAAEEGDYDNDVRKSSALSEAEAEGENDVLPGLVSAIAATAGNASALKTAADTAKEADFAEDCQTVMQSLMHRLDDANELCSRIRDNATSESAACNSLFVILQKRMMKTREECSRESVAMMPPSVPAGASSSVVPQIASTSPTPPQPETSTTTTTPTTSAPMTATPEAAAPATAMPASSKGDAPESASFKGVSPGEQLKQQQPAAANSTQAADPNQFQANGTQQQAPAEDSNSIPTKGAPVAEGGDQASPSSTEEEDGGEEDEDEDEEEQVEQDEYEYEEEEPDQAEVFSSESAVTPNTTEPCASSSKAQERSANSSVTPCYAVQTTKMLPPSTSNQTYSLATWSIPSVHSKRAEMHESPSSLSQNVPKRIHERNPRTLQSSRSSHLASSLPSKHVKMNPRQPVQDNTLYQNVANNAQDGAPEDESGDKIVTSFEAALRSMKVGYSEKVGAAQHSKQSCPLTMPQDERCTLHPSMECTYATSFWPNGQPRGWVSAYCSRGSWEFATGESEEVAALMASERNGKRKHRRRKRKKNNMELDADLQEEEDQIAKKRKDLESADMMAKDVAEVINYATKVIEKHGGEAAKAAPDKEKGADATKADAEAEATEVEQNENAPSLNEAVHSSSVPAKAKDDKSKVEMTEDQKQKVRQECAQTSCGWTLDWSCPGQKGRWKAFADTTLAYRCCCELGMWRSVKKVPDGAFI